MNILEKHFKSVITTVLYIVAFVLTIFGYLFTIYEYPSKGNNIPDIVSMDSVIAILVFTALSIFVSLVALWIKRKKRIVRYVFITLLVLNMYKIIQIIILNYSI
ncbi:hypothetical protein [Abyssisolibacter fermentans]|uniref:hypothetical protein n=1 Tax=Abyssisolibacter fermentans TaxID=1766203 RepID=UPI00082F90F2|nr:hypothetical protein [Abyssisolibacter fermentans]